MKRALVLAGLVAIALTGCGGSSEMPAEKSPVFMRGFNEGAKLTDVYANDSADYAKIRCAVPQESADAEYRAGCEQGFREYKNAVPKKAQDEKAAKQQAYDSGVSAANAAISPKPEDAESACKLEASVYGASGQAWMDTCVDAYLGSLSDYDDGSNG